MSLLTDLERNIYETATMADSEVLYALVQRCKIAMMKAPEGGEQELHDACQSAISVIEFLHHSAMRRLYN